MGDILEERNIQNSLLLCGGLQISEGNVVRWMLLKNLVCDPPVLFSWNDELMVFECDVLVFFSFLADSNIDTVRDVVPKRIAESVKDLHINGIFQVGVFLLFAELENVRVAHIGKVAGTMVTHRLVEKFPQKSSWQR